MELLELIKTRRSIRKYTAEPISEEHIKALKTAALCAPTSKNCKDWKFIFVTNKETIEALSTAKEGTGEFLAGAPLAIVVAADTTLTDVWVEDTSIAASYIQLMAHNLGLGSCWAQMRLRKNSEGNNASENIKKLLSLSADDEVMCVIGVGHPDQQRKPYEEEKLPWEKVVDIK
ncbi:MAG: nitroreductase family protein [Bacteroidia bacterium]|nr:nitroreductase family protein [Bacteroidia bacterium]